MIAGMRWHRLALLLALAGCGGGGTCPQIGCVSELVVQLPAGTTAGTACVAEVCTSAITGGELRVPLSRRGDDETAAVTVTLPGRAQPFAGEVPLDRTRPNGRSCPPVCVNGTARVDAASGQVVAVPAPDAASS